MDRAALVAFEQAYVGLSRELVPEGEASGIWAGLEQPGTGARVVAGWWCRPHAGTGLVVLPNPWVDLQVIAQMEAWCWEVVQSLVRRLGPSLNSLHGTSLGLDYWDLLLAPWLVHLVSGVADRRLFLLAAANIVPGALLDGTTSAEAPDTMDAAVRAFQGPEGNTALLRLVAQGLGTPSVSSPAPTHAVQWTPPTRSMRSRLTRLISSPRRNVQLLPGLLSVAIARKALTLSRCPRVTVVGQSGLSGRDILTLGRSVPGLRVIPAARSGLPHVAPSPEMRSALPCPEEAQDSLERLVLGLLPELMPCSVLEGYRATRDSSLQSYGSPTAVVACNYAADEIQNEFLARCVEAGHPLAFAQHGGFYQQGEVNAQERLELRSGTEFWSWGARAPGVVPVASPRLERLRRSHRGGRDIVLVECTHPADTYVLRFSSTPLGNQALEPMTDLAAFVEASSGAARELMRLKRFPPVLRPAPRPPALETLPSAGPRGAVTASGWMQRARLVVVAYPDTPFIEAMVIGVPTVGLWNTRRWTWRKDVAPIMERLENVGIVYSDPRRAADHVSTILHDVESWWSDPDVVCARADFLGRMAAEGDWKAAWVSGLSRLSRVSASKR